MIKNSQAGQITVFSALILVAVLILAGIIVDLARISAGRSIVKKAAATSARSLLAEYGSRLKEGYGLFAMPQKGPDELNDLFEGYLAGNLSIPGDGEKQSSDMDLFGFRIERINVIPVYNLSENEVTKHQILEYMKYRAPAELVEGFIAKLSAVKEVGKMSAAYKRKVGIDKILGSMDKAQQRLKKSIDGTGNAADKFINGFNLGGSFESVFNRYNSLSQVLSSVKNSLDSASSGIAALDEQLRQEEESERKEGEGQKKDPERKDDTVQENKPSDITKAKLADMKSEQSDLQRSYSETMGEMDTAWHEIRYSMTEDFISVNEGAAAEIWKIAEKGQKAQQAIADLEAYLEQNFGSEKGEFSESFSDQTRSELEQLKGLILEGKKAEAMLDKVHNNSTLLRNITGMLDSAAGMNGSASIPASLPAGLLEMAKGYANLIYDYSKPNRSEGKEDPRSGKAEAVKGFIIKEVLKDVNYVTQGIKEEDLPSHTKNATKNYDTEDALFLNRTPAETAGQAVKAPGVSYGGSLDNIDRDADLYDEEGMFQENALGFISDIGNMISGKAVDLRDNIYINEYIMGAFKNTVAETVQGNSTGSAMTLQGIRRSGLPTFYDSEVEYILHGNASQTLNNIMTKGELLLVRFGLNTLHVYTDPQKKTIAAGIAASVAGWWTGGAGIPIVSNLIMSGWGLGEAIIDIEELLDGKSVPIYKMKGDWRLDIGLPSKAGIMPKTDRRLYFDYQDYMRLFLMTMNEDKKLGRIEDLIQLNISSTKSDFKISGCSTYVRVEAEVSMKYIFLTQPFVQKALKTQDGRYIFKILLYEGYQ